MARRRKRRVTRRKTTVKCLTVAKKKQVRKAIAGLKRLL